MSKILIVNSSALAAESVSSRITTAFAEKVRKQDPNVEITIRDVGADPIPHLTPETVGAIRGAEPETDLARQALALSNQLISEIKDADIIVIGSPMYNFGMSSTLKTWFDHIARAGLTFRYSESGPEGLVKGKKAIVVESRAGFYSEGAGTVMDSQEPHIRNLLGFIGIDDVTFVRIEKLAFGPETAEASIAAALSEIEAISHEQRAIAA